MNQFPVDIDSESVFLDNTWYTKDDLARRIKQMIDQQDFNVARPSAALEELTATLKSVRTLMFKVTPELADSLSELATRTQKSVGQLLRDAVTQLIAQPISLPNPIPSPLRRTEPTKPVITAIPARQPVPARSAPVARDSEPTVEVAGTEHRWFNHQA